jgi:hypothetical protein
LKNEQVHRIRHSVRADEEADLLNHIEPLYNRNDETSRTARPRQPNFLGAFFTDQLEHELAARSRWFGTRNTEGISLLVVDLNNELMDCVL